GYTTLSYNAGSPSYEFYERNAYIRNPPNPELRWEKVKTINFGTDFSLLNNRISGALDYYVKYTSDLLTPNTLDPTTGVNSLIMNVANTKTNGLDLRLNTLNTSGKLQWKTTFLYSFNKNIVTKYLLRRTNSSNYISSGVTPEEGYSVFPTFSYRFAGLDPENGDPIGYFEGGESKDYSKLIINTPVTELKYHGSSRPLIFGTLRNDFTIKDFSLSFNLGFYFKYFFRRPSFSSAALIGGEGHDDYYKRWQKKGDEQQTIVPSFQYPANSYRDQFYLMSEAVVEPGDHIRLEDIRLSYIIPKIDRLKVGLINLSLYANNLGIIWRKNKLSLDPQNPYSVSAPRSIALGLNVKF
ncbi:MAG: SusC/RagA family TonB-linked outer membrane protein, partial [Sphingobacterium sp.]